MLYLKALGWERREKNDRGTLGQRPLCIVHSSVFYQMSRGDSDGFGSLVMFPSSFPIHSFLAWNCQDLLQLQGSIFSFSLFCSILFNLNLAFSFSRLFWIQTRCQSSARSLPLGRAHKIRLGTVLALLWRCSVWHCLSADHSDVINGLDVLLQDRCSVTWSLKSPCKFKCVHWA